MDFIPSDILSGELIPVLLGFTLETVETARRMNRTYGVRSHVFCDKVPLPFRLSVSMRFHTVPHTKDEHLMLHALTDFADQYRGADIILYLIPCTEEYASMIWCFQKELEARYVLADRAQIEQVWFGSEAAEAKQKEQF